MLHPLHVASRVLPPRRKLSRGAEMSVWPCRKAGCFTVRQEDKEHTPLLPDIPHLQMGVLPLTAVDDLGWG